jgi:hypothetical protein
MELEPEPEPKLFKSSNRNRNWNHNFSKVGTGTGTITFQKLEPQRMFMRIIHVWRTVLGLTKGLGRWLVHLMVFIIKNASISGKKIYCTVFKRHPKS